MTLSPAGLRRARSHAAFLVALWKANLQSAVEYRGSFLTQVVGMMINNAVYFMFWVIFFDRFEQVRGWGLQEMMVLFGVVASGFGLAVLLFGNIVHLANLIATGRLDYYLALPRPVLLHALASRSLPSGLGDLSYGIISFAAAGSHAPADFARFAVGALLSMTVFVAFLVLVQGLAFWLGNAQVLSAQAMNAVMMFALYPITLFDGTAKLVLFTVIPAAFLGAVPAAYVSGADWRTLAGLTVAAGVLLALAVGVFRRGLARYESGSAIGAQV